MSRSKNKTVIEDTTPIDTNFDKLGIGKLSEKEMNLILANTSTKMSNSDFQNVAVQLDRMNDDPRDFNDFFLQIAQSRQVNKEIIPKVIESFKVFDTQKNGKINIDLMKVLLQNFGTKLKPAEIDDIIANLDEVEDNQIDYEVLLKNLFKGF